MFTEVLGKAIRILEGSDRFVVLPERGELIVVGDIHGDLVTLKRILEKEEVEGWLGGDHYVLFLGDYVDRGPDSLGVLQTVSELLVNHPEHVFLLRGNHEGPRDVPARPRSYISEVVRFGEDASAVMEAVQHFMDCLLTAAVVPGYAFLVHGHIPLSTTSLSRIAVAHLNHPDNPTLIEMLWSDPTFMPLDSLNSRGHGYNVGTASTEKFLKENHLKWVIRGHMSYPEGYGICGKTLTLHSLTLPIYGNPKAAYLKLPLDTNRDPVNYVKQLQKKNLITGNQ